MNKKKAYEVLGLDPSADEDTIKKTYKKLASKYHPDKHVGADEAKRKEVEAKFKEAKEAYEFLTDPKKMAQAEYEGARFTDDLNQMPPHVRAMMEEMMRQQEEARKTQVATYTVSLEEAFNGCERDVHMNWVDINTSIEIKPGVVPGVRIGVFSGNGRKLDLRVNIDTGERQVNWAVVPNIYGGGTLNSGDMIQPYSVKWIDLMLGADLKVKCVDGDEVTFRCPAGLKPGMRIRVAGRGYWRDMQKSGRGDLYLQIIPEIPKFKDIPEADMTRFINAWKEQEAAKEAK